MAVKSIDDMKVLIVDDDPDDLKVIKKSLDKYGFTASNIETLEIKSRNLLHGEIKRNIKEKNIDILFFDLKYENSVEEGLEELEKLIHEVPYILLIAVYILTSAPEVANNRPRVKALMVDALKKPIDGKLTSYVLLFEGKSIEEVVKPIVDSHSGIKEKMQTFELVMEVSDKIDRLQKSNNLVIDKLDNIKDKISYIELSNKAMLALIPDTMDSKKKVKAQRFIEEKIDDVEFPENLKREGIFSIVKDTVVESFKEGIKKESITIIKEKLGDQLKEILIEKAQENGLDVDDTVYAGLFLAKNTLVDFAKVIGVNIE